MFNGAGALGANAAFNVYSPAGVLLDTFTVPAATDSTMHPVTVPDVNVGYLDIVAPQTGWGFYIDNVQFALTPLQVTSSIAQAVAISWSSVSGGLYQVLWKSPLTGSAWAPLGSPVVGTGGTMTAFDVITGGSRFYHVERVGVAYDTKLLTVVGPAPLMVKPTNSGTAPEVTAQPAPASAAKVSTVVGEAPAGAKPTNEGSTPGDNAQPVPGKETNGQHPSSSKSLSTRSVQKADSN